MILSASRRTDIPAFFADWFFNRLKEGFLYVRNPVNIHQITKITLSRQIIDCIVFWTKNPQSMLPRLQLLNDYHFYFQFTITGYGPKLEPKVPPTEEVIKSFIQLSDRLGANKVIWRYDPIIFSEEMNESFHETNFANIAERLQGKTLQCVISFLDLYKKTVRNLASLNHHQPAHNAMLSLAGKLHRIATNHGISLASCAEETDLTSAGISHGRCIDKRLIEDICGFSLKIGKDKNQRKSCGCAASIDIGAYNTCPHACLYCYANHNSKEAAQNFAEHDPSSPLIFGKIGPKDRIYERKLLSHRELQPGLFE